MSAGFWGVRLDSLGLMRDIVKGAGAGASIGEPSDSMSGSEDSRRLFLDVLFLIAS